MDTLAQIRYTMGHETPWDRQAIGTSQTSSHRPATSGEDVPHRGADLEGILELRGALGPGLSPEGAEGVAGAGECGGPLPVVEAAEGTVKAAIGSGSGEGRLRDRHVDPAAYCQTDQKAVWGPLPHRGRLEAPAHGLGLELAKTRTPGHPAGRGGHRTLEDPYLAPYKKTPNAVGPISCSSTKAGFCSSLTCARPGRPGGTRPSCATATSATGSLPSPASRSLRPIDAWDCMCSSTRPTSPGWRSSTSSSTSCGISAGQWSSSGMAALFTNAKRPGAILNRARHRPNHVQRIAGGRHALMSLCGPR